MCMCVLKNRLLHYTQSVAQHGLYILNLLPMLMITLNVASKATKLEIFSAQFFGGCSEKDHVDPSSSSMRTLAISHSLMEA